MSPLLSCPRLGAEPGPAEAARQGRVAASYRQLQEPGDDGGGEHGQALGVKRLALPTAGNAGGAAAAYGARAGLEVYVLMPEDTPVVNQMEAYLYGPKPTWSTA